MTSYPYLDRDGWATFPDPPDGIDGLHVRLRARDGRLVVGEVYLHSGDELPNGAVRRLSIARLEALINAYAESTLEAGGEDDGAVSALQERRLRRRVIELMAAPDAPEPTLADLRGRPAEIRQVREATAAAKRPALTRPDREDLDGFYARVAAAYQEYAAITNAPAAAIAGEAGVPVTTVHRWVREARRRGQLPPARKGRAG